MYYHWSALAACQWTRGIITSQRALGFGNWSCAVSSECRWLRCGGGTRSWQRCARASGQRARRRRASCSPNTLSSQTCRVGGGSRPMRFGQHGRLSTSGSSHASATRAARRSRPFSRAAEARQTWCHHRWLAPREQYRLAHVSVQSQRHAALTTARPLLRGAPTARCWCSERTPPHINRGYSWNRHGKSLYETCRVSC